MVQLASDAQSVVSQCVLCSVKATVKGLCKSCYNAQWSKNDYVKNADKYKRASQKWRELNRERSRAVIAKWRAAHRAEDRMRSKIWKANNLKRHAAHEATRRARKAGTGGKFTWQDICNLLHKQQSKCPICKTDITDIYHIDHILPIKLGGSSFPNNIQLLCPPCNMRKHSKHPVDFIREMGLLV